MTSFIAAVITAACGIPEEQFNEAQNKIKKLKAESAEAQKLCDDALTDLKSKNQTLTNENQALKTKLVSLGQNLTEIKTQAGQMVQDLSQKDQQIAELLKAQEAARKRAAMFKGLVKRFQKMIDSGKLKVQMRRNRMVVQMSDKILFDSGKARLKKDGKEALAEVASVLASVKDRNFQVAGHTDNIPIRSRRFKSNWELSTARAVNVVRFMIENGMGSGRISAAGYAEFDPVGDNSTKEGRQMNRRIEITLMPNLAELPGMQAS
jgi:chemotaxis protein MotB